MKIIITYIIENPYSKNKSLETIEISEKEILDYAIFREKSKNPTRYEINNVYGWEIKEIKSN